MTRAELGIGFLVLWGSACSATRQETVGGEQVRTVLSQTLPAMNGSALKTTVVEVVYGPGGSSAPHRHPCAVIGYVVAGALRSQTDGAPATTYHAGDSFYEAPNSVHRVSANASNTDPVRFTASFICDHETPLSLPSSEGDTTRRGPQR